MPINALHTDRKIQDIRKEAQQKSAAIPFLLLPVRLETRFMEVERAKNPIAQIQIVTELLKDITELNLLLEENISTMDQGQKDTFIKVFSFEAEKIAQKLNLVTQQTKQQRQWFERLHTDMRRSADKATTTLDGNTSRIIKRVVIILGKDIAKVKTVKEETAKNTAQFLKEMKLLKKNLLVFQNNKTPFTKKESKKRLYKYIDQNIERVKLFYRSALQKIEGIHYIEQNQLTLIRNVNKDIQRLLIALAKHIKPLHGDKNWVAFVDATSQLIKNEFAPIFKHFETSVLSKLEDIQQLSSINANQYLFQSLVVYQALEAYNKKQVSGYYAIKTVKLQLKHKIKQLEKYQQKPIVGTEEQLVLIKKVWVNINEAISRFSKKASTVKKLNKSQAYGLKTSLSFLQQVAKEHMANLVRNKRTNQNNRTQLAAGKKLIDVSIAQLNKLERNINLNRGIPEKFIESLEEILEELQLANRKLIPFVKEDLSRLIAALERFTTLIKERLFRSVILFKAYHSFIEDFKKNLLVAQKRVLPLGMEKGVQFIAPTALKKELWVRIYPDDIFVHTHEKALTADEIKSAQRYWQILWVSGGDKDLALGAWKSLCASYNSRRAAWLVKVIGDLKIPVSNSSANNNPSKDINKIAALLQRLLQPLGPITANTSPSTIAAINLHQVANDLVDIALTYSRIKTRPQLKFLIEKTIGIQYKVTAKIELMLKILAKSAAVSAPLQSIIAQIEWSLGEFQKHIPQFKLVNMDAYLNLFGAPYIYNKASLQAKKAEWTVAPHARVLPKRFVVITRNKGKYQHIQVGNPIPDNLQLGLNPDTFDFKEEKDNPFQSDAEGNLLVEEGMKWMVDFEEATKKGMGIIVPLTATQAADGFDEVFVLGINKDEVSDSKLLEDLLENHHYSVGGMEFLKIGTATNNTEDATSGYTRAEAEPSDSCHIEIGQPLFFSGIPENKFAQADGDILAKALGIRSTNFQHIKNSNLNQIGQAKAMHHVLWNSTIGGYMEDMWDKVFTYDNIARTKAFFLQNVTARGSLPSLRIGSQPYGILPTTAFSRMRFHKKHHISNQPELLGPALMHPEQIEADLQLRFDIRLLEAFRLLQNTWSNLRKEYVKHAGNMEQAADPQKAFMTMLGLNASSSAYHFRYGANVNNRTAISDIGNDFKKDVFYSPFTVHAKFRQLISTGYFLPSFRWEDQMASFSGAEPDNRKTYVRVRDQVYKSRIFAFRYLDRHALVGGSWVSPPNYVDGKLPRTHNNVNYIEWLIDPKRDLVQEIFKENKVKEMPSQSILFMLLRQSLLLCYRDAALNILQTEDFFTEPFRRFFGSREHYIRNSNRQFGTKWVHLLEPLQHMNNGFYFDKKNIQDKPFYKFLNNKQSLADYLTDSNLQTTFNKNEHRSEFDKVKELRETMQYISTFSIKELTQLYAEHIDLCSYRLDAWMTGLATRRLKEGRKQQQQGIYLGAYAWVENLRPGGARKEALDLPANLATAKETIYTDEDNEGYIHTPSLNHAIAAAVLRSGYKANEEAASDVNNRMAVNLSSARVRKALHLINGMQQGQDIAALLGFQFERGLHERNKNIELDKFILPLRKKFPLIVPVDAATAGEEPPSENNVVHGLDLLESLTDAKNQAGGDPVLAQESSLYEYFTFNTFQYCPSWLSTFVVQKGGGEEELRAIIKEIDYLADAFDALGDIAISESVYQIVKGNHVRAAAMLSALGDGKTMPVPEFTNTPRSGTVVSHRVLLHIEPTNNAPIGWSATLSPRAKAEPSLNNWLASQIGDPANIRCLIENPTTKEQWTISLDELALQAIDLLYLVSSNMEEGNPNLIARIAYFIRERETIAPDATLSILYTSRATDWGSDVYSFYELELLIVQLNFLLQDAKPLGATDMLLPADDPNIDNPDEYDLPAFTIRVNTLVNAAKDYCNSLQDFLNTNHTLTTTAQFNTAYRHLITANNFAIANVLSTINYKKEEQDSIVLIASLKRVLKIVKERVDLAATHKASLAQLTSSQRRISELGKMAKTILGEDFILLPSYKLNDTSAIESQLQLPPEKALLRHNVNVLAMEEWLQTLATVREKMYSLEMIRAINETFQVPTSALIPVQFPYKEQDYWLGQAYPPSYVPEEDKLSLVLLNKTQAINTIQVGLVLDEWTEIIPNKEEVTGISIHYDQPDASPPQTLLLAVSPKPITEKGHQYTWEWDDLVYTLKDTLLLAKNRTVEPDQLENSMLGQVLPAIVSEVLNPQQKAGIDVDGMPAVMDFVDNLPD